MAGAKAAGGLASVGGAVAAALLIAGQLQLLLLRSGLPTILFRQLILP